MADRDDPDRLERADAERAWLAADPDPLPWPPADGPESDGYRYDADGNPFF